ncbi:hypoxanthine/guanine phosphoribosyltransferase [Methanoplanus endosymbiosus]|uniref:Hypoxanthine/guanine phosphoribosyltransferase n=1 Tax=Methanoplanus endosymbiosus TaxID=33865 RepID=A0A9E7PNX6_9EURY|nr:hypoxanthine/guanine phosphoribosyltransferase [Methanoplanus endosymbiosus]UUX93754.1 hypoxanthine/guanine phosphoribosyltransferase [Methanoplanus endosymbiosus]
MFNKLTESLEKCPIVKRGEYNYFIHPVSDGVPIVEPSLLREVAVLMVKSLDLEGVTKIVVAEAMGIHIGVALSLMTDIPLTIIRKREYQLEGEIALHQTTGYSKGELYLNGIEKGEKVVVIDDVFSTGGTMKAILKGIAEKGAEVSDVLVVIKRGECDIGRPYKYLVEIEVTGDGVRVTDTKF